FFCRLPARASASSCFASAATCRRYAPLGIKGVAVLFGRAGGGATTVVFALTGFDGGGATAAFGTGSRCGCALGALPLSSNFQTGSLEAEVAGSESTGSVEELADFFGAASGLEFTTGSVLPMELEAARTCPSY